MSGADHHRRHRHERFVAGPAGWSWHLLHPVTAALVWGRNAVSLETLASFVERAADRFVDRRGTSSATSGRGSSEPATHVGLGSG